MLVWCAGCDNEGTFVPEGAVISSDPCYHTVCVVDSSGKGTFQTSFKGKLTIFLSVCLSALSVSVSVSVCLSVCLSLPFHPFLILFLPPPPVLWGVGWGGVGLSFGTFGAFSPCFSF